MANFGIDERAIPNRCASSCSGGLFSLILNLNQGAEFLGAKKAGLIGDEHIVAEIAQVLSGGIGGRRSADEITVYKSLGHVVQDLASAWALYSQQE
jgi:ornithine cyclodeaminase/alanine dehydrogenase-like protein (mu-crystallin family)